MTLKLLQCTILTLYFTLSFQRFKVYVLSCLTVSAKLLILDVSKYLWNWSNRAEALSMTTLQFSISNPHTVWFHLCSWLLIKNSSSFYIYYILYNSVKIVLQGDIYVKRVSKNEWQIQFKITMWFSFSHKYIFFFINSPCLSL